MFGIIGLPLAFRRWMSAARCSSTCLVLTLGSPARACSTLMTYTGMLTKKAQYTTQIYSLWSVSYILTYMLVNILLGSLKFAVGGRGDQAYSRLSTTHGHITDCKLDSAVFAGVCVWVTCGPVLFGPNDVRPTFFGCQATDSIPPQVNRKESLRPFILTPSRTFGCLTH